MAANTFQTSLNYLSSTRLYGTEKPYEIWLDDVPAGLRPTNVAFQLYPDISIHDARAVGLESFSIEEHGFEFRRHPFPKDRCPISTAEDSIPTNEQRDAILSYIDVMNSFLCETLGGEKAVCFDWRIRRAKGTPISKFPNMYSLDEDVDARRMTIEVAHSIHADGSPDGIRRSLSYLLTDEEKADIEAGKYRVRIINVWRPLVPRIQNDALAFCDRRTVEEQDWETVEKVQPNWIEESMYPRRSEKHQWFSLRDQTQDEVAMFVVWDLDRADELRASVAHSSIKLPNPPADAQPRVSIETRYILWNRK